MSTALKIEWLKLSRSAVAPWASAIYLGGLIVVVGIVNIGLRLGNERLMAKVGSGPVQDWEGLVIQVSQVIMVGGTLTAGVVIAWLFAREYADETIVLLMSTAVPRHHIAVAKFVMFLAWVIAVNVVLCVLLAASGVSLGFGVGASIWQVLTLGIGTMWYVAPIAWVATRTRSMLAGVGVTVIELLLLQVFGIVGAEIALVVVWPAVVLVGCWVTYVAWKHLEI